MHTPLDPHLHSEKCNKIISDMVDCHLEYHKGWRLLGYCSKEYEAMRKCLRGERIERTKQHLKDSRIRNQNIRDNISKMEKEGKDWRDYAKEKIGEKSQQQNE